MSHQGALQRLISVHEVREKHGHVCSDVVGYLHIHDVKIVAQPPFKNEGLVLIVNSAGLTEKMDFSAMPHKMRDGEEISI